MFSLTRLVFSSISLVALLSCCELANADGYPWQPQPGKAPIMVVSAHPDDESIFFGGVIPYYTQVLNLPLVLVDMVSNGYGNPPSIREDELRDSTWIYGMRNEPLFIRAPDIDSAGWSRYNDWGGTDYAVELVAEHIRRYQPAVIVTHDFDGEYGHVGHRETATVVTLAYDVAADPNVDVGGLEPWQAKKLYVHQSEANGLGTEGYTFQNWLFHDDWETIAIDTDGDELPDSSARQVADAGLDVHVSLGDFDVSTVYRQDENFDGDHSEWWGLYASTVGPDTVQSPFEIAGTGYADWARGDFLEHLDLTEYLPRPGIPGDVNLDGVVTGDGTGDWESDDVAAFLRGWGTTGHVTIEEKWLHGDMTLDGFTNFVDWQLLRINHEDPSSIADLESLFAAVPEPASWLLLSLGWGALVVQENRRRRTSGAG